MGLAATDTVLPMTPMFHANGAWGFTHAAPMVGGQTRSARPQNGCGQHCRTDRDRRCHRHSWRADALLEAAPAFRGAGPRSGHHETAGGGRLRACAQHDRGLRAPRRFGQPRLGHDRDQSMRNVHTALAEDSEGVSPGEASPQDHAGHAGLRRRCQDCR